jgi:hypothetical protein
LIIVLFFQVDFARGAAKPMFPLWKQYLRLPAAFFAMMQDHITAVITDFQQLFCQKIYSA